MKERVVLVTGASRGIGKAKHALAGWTESLDLEVRPFGIRATLIQPGFFRTDIDRKSSIGSLPKRVYERKRARVVEKLRLSVESGDDPVKVAEAVVQASTKKHPNTKVLVGRGARQARLFRTFLPSALFELGLRRQLGLTYKPGC